MDKIKEQLQLCNFRIEEETNRFISISIIDTGSPLTGLVGQRGLSAIEDLEGILNALWVSSQGTVMVFRKNVYEI